MDTVRDFTANHPTWNEEHVQHLAAWAERESIPYCTECHDWHRSSEEHSL